MEGRENHMIEVKKTFRIYVEMKIFLCVFVTLSPSHPVTSRTSMILSVWYLSM